MLTVMSRVQDSGMNWSKTCGGLLTGVSIGRQINWRKNHRLREGAELCKFINLAACWHFGDQTIYILQQTCWVLSQFSEAGSRGKGQGGVGAPLALHWVGALTMVISHQAVRKSNNGVSMSNYAYQEVPQSTCLCDGVPKVPQNIKVLWSVAKQSKIQHLWKPCMSPF